MKSEEEETRISPTQFMRQLRPEYYSDTVARQRYELTGPELEYRLATVTARNEMHSFEIFCRKLCERAVCPNLRPATGPEGGGDGKADAETFQVADEIANFWYAGNAQAAKERWAFAFSAKETWKQKVRDDVKGLIKTGRPYVQIICVTSQFARSRDRSELQDELGETYGIPVTVHDRSWIVEQVIEHDWCDLAVNYLGVGKESTDRRRLGPNDYSREQQLEDLERQLSNPGGFSGMEMQLATEALVAAKLSRGMERPRLETDGRFARAIRLAKAHGTHRQLLEALYESIWTAFWWYDDFDFLNERYNELEQLALESPYALNLEFLVNVGQLLFNTIIHGHRTVEQVRLNERIPRLVARLSALAGDETRPNNALEAKVSILMLHGAQASLGGDSQAFSQLWREFSEVIERARGLGEFSADRLTHLITAMGQLAGDDPAYAKLVDEVAQFVSERTGEAEGAIVLLKRARQLEDHLEIIRILGRAVRQLTKKEYRKEQGDALMWLAEAYRSAGMVWAARANILVALAAMFIQADEDSGIPTVTVVPTSLYLAGLAMELRYFPEAMEALRLARGCAFQQPLDGASRRRFFDELKRKDDVLACQLISLEPASFEKTVRLPDVLARLELTNSRYALLYALGYEHILRDEGWAPEKHSPEKLACLFDLMASQPCAHGDVDIFNSAGQPQSLVTRVLGIRVEVRHSGSHIGVQVAEVVAGTIEALFATALQANIFAHTEDFLLTIDESQAVARPDYEFNNRGGRATLHWPHDLAPGSPSKQEDIQPILVGLAFTILVATCQVDHVKVSIEKFVKDESLLDRVGIIVTAGNSRQRLFSSLVSRIEDFDDLASSTYPPKPERPRIVQTELRPDPDEEDRSTDKAPNDHRDVRVRSVIDVHGWTMARWLGTGFGSMGPGRPPVLGLMFADEQAARDIFVRWQERFGSVDEDDAIYLAIIRNVSQDNPHQYAVLITSNLPASDLTNAVSVVSRTMTMPAKTSDHLNGFLEAYGANQAYMLAPMVLRRGHPPKFLMEDALLKRRLSVKNASDVTEQDIEYMAIGSLKGNTPTA